MQAWPVFANFNGSTALDDFFVSDFMLDVHTCSEFSLVANTKVGTLKHLPHFHRIMDIFFSARGSLLFGRYLHFPWGAGQG